VFGTPGTPRTIQEKLADAAKVNELTGLAPKVALHIPWDKVDDYAALRSDAADLGVAMVRTGCRPRWRKPTTLGWPECSGDGRDRIPTPDRRYAQRQLTM